MHDERDVDRQPKARKKLVLNKETVRVLTDQEQMAIEGGASPTAACNTCGHNYSVCAPGPQEP